MNNLWKVGIVPPPSGGSNMKDNWFHGLTPVATLCRPLAGAESAGRPLAGAESADLPLAGALRNLRNLRIVL